MKLQEIQTIAVNLVYTYVFRTWNLQLLPQKLIINVSIVYDLNIVDYPSYEKIYFSLDIQ